MHTYVVEVVTVGSFTITANSRAEAEAELDLYSDGEVMSAAEFDESVESVTIVSED